MYDGSLQETKSVPTIFMVGTKIKTVWIKQIRWPEVVKLIMVGFDKNKSGLTLIGIDGQRHASATWLGPRWRVGPIENDVAVTRGWDPISMCHCHITCLGHLNPPV